MTPLAWLLASTTLCASPGPPYEGPWRWPLAPAPRVLRAFEAPPEPWAAGHRGVDLAARPGQPVYAAGAGRVTYAADLAGRGVIVISHGELRTTYLPVRASVRPGREIRAGERIGAVESRAGHCGRMPCLHWGVLRGPAYVDPLSLLGAGRTRLLPVWGVPPPQADPPIRRPAQSPLPLTGPPRTPHPPRAPHLRESAPSLLRAPHLRESGAPHLGESGAPHLGESGAPHLGESGAPRLGESGAPRSDPPVAAAPPAPSAPHLPLLGAASGAAALAIVSACAPRKARRPTPPP